MAKKTTTKAKETVAKKETVENTINAITEEVLPVEVVELTEKLEELKPSEELVQEVIENPTKAEEILSDKLEELNNLEELVQKEIKKVLPKISSKKNSAFSYMWNGMNFYE